MRVIGIDPGTALTGYGVLETDEHGSITTLDYGVIETLKDRTPSERLLDLYNKLIKVIQLHRPAQGAVEKLFFQKNVKTALSVGQARGVVMLGLEQNGITPVEYTPNEIKLAVTGYGAADKKQVQKMVQMLLKLDSIPTPDDAADALAVAICHLHSASFQQRIQEQL
ncbi:MAG: crossover junction endodeoxyribonuclease RuvC [Anaerolineales bacterium]|nr:crossover junction endodeoxyribonuclease RuvC [Anaerolineales bacterium]